MPGVTDPMFKGSTTSPALPDLGLVGSDIAGYRVKELLDQGGMSWVYEATHPEIGRRAAVKVLKAEGHNDAESRNRFLLEAKAVAALTNKHVVEIWNYGILPDGRQYLMMPLLEGEALDRYLARLGSLPPAQALQIIEQTLNALSEAHKKGIVHRDVKPGNIFLVREHTGELLVKVMDFGLAAARPVAMPEGDGPAKASWVAGTPCYVAPEQARGLAATPAADLYAVGVTLYELIAGDPPFPDSPDQPVAELLRKHLSEPPPRLTTKVANLPEGIDELVSALLEKDPAKRPASADVARVQVQRILKRMASDATAVKGMMLPGLAPGAPVARQATEKVLGPPPDDRVTLHIAERKRARGAWLAGLLVLLLLVGFGVSRLAGSGAASVATPPVVTPPVPPKVEEPVKQPVAVKPPEPVEPVKIEEPKKPEMDSDPLVAPVMKAPLVKRPPRIGKYDCEPDDGWRAQKQRDLQELTNLANHSPYAEEWMKEEPPLEAQVKSAGPAECGALEKRLEDLAARYSKAH